MEGFDWKTHREGYLMIFSEFIQMLKTPFRDIPSKYPYFLIGTLLLFSGIVFEQYIKFVGYIVGLIGLFLWIYEFNIREHKL